MPFTDFEAYFGAVLADDTGTKKDGTVFNEALFTAFGAALDSIVLSVGNPSVYPYVTTDEVVDAKGAYASLAARLDAIADPTTGVPLAATFLSYLLKTDAALQIGATNLACNDDYLLWPNGDTSVPSYVTLFGGVSPTIARTGSGLADTNTKVGPFSMSLVFASNPCGYYRTIISATAAANLGHLKGSQKFAAGIWVKCATANVVRVFIDDGAAVTYSSYHPGDNTWQFLTIAPTAWSGGATQLLFGLRMEAASTAWVSGDTIVASDIAIARHIPCPTEEVEVASTYVSGNAAVGDDKLLLTTPFPFLLRDTMLAIYTAVPTVSAFVADIDWLDFSGGGVPAKQTAYSTRPQIAATANTGRAAPDGTYQYRCFQPNFSGGKKGGGMTINFDTDDGGNTTSGVFVKVIGLRYKRPEWLSRCGGPVDGY